MSFKRELAAYKRELPHLLAREGKFVLIHGDEVVCVRKTWDRAVSEGYKRFGPNEPFMVKRIERPDRLAYAPIHGMVVANGGNHSSSKGRRRDR